MSKRNITYIKPEEPSFLKKLKQEAGYVEKDTVETKREVLPLATEDDTKDHDDEQPVVVVLKAGDLSAEEAASYQSQKERENLEKPADLSERVVFRAPNKKDAEHRVEKSRSDSKHSGKRQKKGISNSKLLSFDEDEQEDY